MAVEAEEEKKDTDNQTNLIKKAEAPETRKLIINPKQPQPSKKQEKI
jgi:hypothetical protein